MRYLVRSTLILVLLLVVSGCGGTVPEGGTPPSPTEDHGTATATPGSVTEDQPTVTEEAEPEGDAEPEGARPVVRLVTHDSFNVSEEVLTAFEEAHGARVEILNLGDAGEMVNKSILSANNPLGDVLYGIDNTFLTRALDAGIFEPYESPNLASVPERFRLDPENRVTPIDYGDVCLNYDIAYFEEAGIEPPDSLEDLVAPEYANLTVVENPATSSPGLAFLLATVGHFGEEGWETYWMELRENGVLVTAGWSEAYFQHFTAGGGEGSYPIVVSYASSPPFTEGATASVLADESCFRQIEFAGILKNGQNSELAQALIDFMLTPTFQNDVPLNMYVFPVIEEAVLPDSFVQYAAVPEKPAEVAPEFIEENRDPLIERWNEIVLR